MFAIIDPLDQQAIGALEDALDVKCFCAERPWQAEYCPIHSPQNLVREVLGSEERQRADERSETEGEFEEAAEEQKEEWEKRLAEKNAEVARLETTQRELRGRIAQLEAELSRLSNQDLERENTILRERLKRIGKLVTEPYLVTAEEES